jgi:hypothetical protein
MSRARARYHASNAAARAAADPSGAATPEGAAAAGACTALSSGQRLWRIAHWPQAVAAAAPGARAGAQRARRRDGSTERTPAPWRAAAIEGFVDALHVTMVFLVEWQRRQSLRSEGGLVRIR